jgi:hypothetical protein
MSIYARTPESHAAWQLVTLYSVFRPDRQIWADYEKGKKELDLLVDGMRLTTIQTSTPLTDLFSFVN